MVMGVFRFTGATSRCMGKRWASVGRCMGKRWASVGRCMGKGWACASAEALSATIFTPMTPVKGEWRSQKRIVGEESVEW